MCGFAGSFKPTGNVCSDEILTAMRDQMIHRGPDGAGIWRETEGRCGLAHRRLSIIDLSESASQPMANHDGSVVLAFNGEIYNHREIRKELEATGRYQWLTDHSDTEALLHAYEEWGMDCMQRLHGMFAFAVYDARDKARPFLHLVRDRVGVKPLYITRTLKGEWLFASEIKAFFPHPDMTKEMDLTAFWHYLTFIVAPAPMTLFKGIFKIPAGHFVSIDASGRAVAHSYWDCLPDKNTLLTPNDISEEEATRRLTELLKKSIERRMVSDVPFGVLLSGGVDSSMNVALMSELMDRPVSTFSIGYEGKEDYNEFQFARRVSQRYKTDHHETLINRNEMQEFLPQLVHIQDEPVADNVCIPLFFLSRLVKQSGTTVVQVGEGADENFLGYWWVEHFRKKAEEVYNPMRNQQLSWWKKMFIKGKSLQPGLLSGEDLEIQKRAQAGQELFWGGATCWWGEMRDQLTPNPSPFMQTVECPIENLLPDSYRELDSHNVVASYMDRLEGRLSEPEILQKIPYMEHKLRLPEHLLMRVDKLTMAHSVEARVPFLDHELVEFAVRLPPSYKLWEGLGKKILKKASEPYLDHDIIYRKKQGFGAPMDEWFMEGDFGEKCLSAFKRSHISKSKLLNNDYFTDLIRHQMKQGGGYSFHIWTVMNAVLWHEYWVEGKADCF
ncbi:MAG: asparagine synthase (glutamine-hydrolyzing) [Candidatus Nitrohelix vancouverensis]|uniref:asparagine synthase (glutamine-hydrolyzing) n=1 Tax=Candidatus Nitrohelix vancouverensis TaxID=2705534 RepID=A0A7T0C2F2_9BACT|nr:MAG: asparagine synthase (glutamine-hydrolyzing) [Candidatus Nitrohelix vancouverensis]